MTTTTKTTEQLLDELAEAGRRRAANNRRGGLDMLLRLRDAYEDIRRLAAEAEGKLTKQRIADAVGVTPQMLHNILTRKTSV